MPVAKRATSLDVAKKAGVSRSTVSFVLNKVPGISISEVTRKRVWNAARRLDYHPNAAGRRLASGKSRTVGFILYQSAEQVFADALLPQVILGFEQAAIQQGFNILLKAVEPQDAGGYVRLIRENHVDGILLSGPRQDDHGIVQLHRDGEPVMLMGQLPGSKIPFVDIDAAAGAALAVRHLIGGGHRRIGMITNAPLSYTSARQRKSGYLQALKDARLKSDARLVQEGAYTPASGHAAMRRLLETPVAGRPTAVFVASDVVATGVLLAIKQAGLRVPEDISVVGFDDIPLAEYFDPPLTTVRLPAMGLGFAAGERLIRLVQGEGLEQPHLLMESELIVRASTGASPGRGA
jgi:DNA-binding LacI/PurR family transcriptional regulator